MSLRSFIAHQFGRPSGLGSLFMGQTLNKVNARVNTLALDRLALRPDDQLLDVGFGGGIGLQLALARLPDGFVAGIEISQPMLRRARRRFRDAIRAGRVQITEADVTALPFPDGRFDKIITINTLHFWPRPVAACRDMWRVLKPGGRLALAIRPKAYLEHIEFTNHGFATFEDDQLGDLLAGAGFTDLSIEHHDDADMGVVLITATRP